MNARFEDIIEVMGEPTWYEAYGFPRYGEFNPKNQMNIYADVAILFRIKCQACSKGFDVCETLTTYKLYQHAAFKELLPKDKNVSLKDYIMPFFNKMTVDELTCFLHYGDPPHHDREDENCVGNTMNCYDIEIRQFWYRRDWEWERVPEMEKKLSDY